MYNKLYVLESKIFMDISVPYAGYCGLKSYSIL